MGLFATKNVSFNGAYFGSHPDFPNAVRNVPLLFNSKGVTFGLLRGRKTYPWSEIVDFDYTGDLINGVFKTVLKTSSGNFELETRSIHVTNAGLNQSYAASRVSRLNKAKRFVHNKLAERGQNTLT